jgi:phage recombination protein Bet
MNAVVSLHNDYTGAQLALIKRTVAKDTNSDEFDLFMAVARMRNLDPFTKQISAIVFSKDNPKKRNMAIITTIEGMRAIAARTRRYRPDEVKPDVERDPTLRGPDNPKGLVSASVTIWIADATRDGGWRPVNGYAEWDEFAPLKEDCPDGWTEEPSGGKWPDGNPKMRRIPKGPLVTVLDTSGNWGKMPVLMLAKCAEAQALRKAFPEDLPGLYEGAELDRARVVEITASETIEAHQTENRLALIGAANTITFQLTAAQPLEPIPLGQIADRIMDTARNFDLRQLRWFESANLHPMREFWARAKTDALEVKAFLEALRLKLEAAEQPVGGQ